MVLLELKREILNGFLIIAAILLIAWMAAEIYRYYQKRQGSKYQQSDNCGDYEGQCSIITKETTLTNDFSENNI